MTLYEITLKALRAREDSLNKDAFAADSLIIKLNNIAEFKAKTMENYTKLPLKIIISF